MNPNPQAETRPEESDLAPPESRPTDEGAAAEPLGPGLAALWGFCYLVQLSFRRQARARVMVWIALGLLAFVTALVGFNTIAGRWGMGHWRWWWRTPGMLGTATEKRRPMPPCYVGLLAFAPPAGLPGGVPWGSVLFSGDEDLTRDQLRYVPAYGPRLIVVPYEQAAQGMEALSSATAWSPEAASLEQAVTGATRALLDRTGFLVFSTWIVYSVFLGFLLPIWSLSFATEALGGDREARSLVWILARPIPRPAVYLAKYLALLPWTIGLNLGGFGLLCLAAGSAGTMAFRLYWPAVLLATLAFSSLFHLIGATFRRPAVVAIVYSFFLEIILGIMPGYLKRVSIGFYARCLMFEQVERLGVTPVRPTVYLPVDGTTAWCVLVGLAAGLLLAGMVIFARSEYRDEA